jgi:hypothetical protein
MSPYCVHKVYDFYSNELISSTIGQIVRRQSGDSVQNNAISLHAVHKKFKAALSRELRLS